MNPFDDMCDEKDIDCLKLAFRDNRQFVGATVSPKAGYMKIQTEGTFPVLIHLHLHWLAYFSLMKTLISILTTLMSKAKHTIS